MAANNDYIKGLFIEEKTSEYGQFLSIGIKRDEFIEQLKSLPVSEKGFVNITASPQKENPNKYSAKPYKPKTNQQVAADGGKTFGGTNGKKDDLPF